MCIHTCNVFTDWKLKQQPTTVGPVLNANAKIRMQYIMSQRRLHHRNTCIASAVAVFLVPDEHSAIFEADDDAIFHNGYRSQRSS